MESKQYRINRVAPGKPYRVQITWGFLDVETIGYKDKLVEARTLAKDHAAKNNIKPLILT